MGEQGDVRPPRTRVAACSWPGWSGTTAGVDAAPVGKRVQQLERGVVEGVGEDRAKAAGAAGGRELDYQPRQRSNGSAPDPLPGHPDRQHFSRRRLPQPEAAVDGVVAQKAPVEGVLEVPGDQGQVDDRRDEHRRGHPAAEQPSTGATASRRARPAAASTPAQARSARFSAWKRSASSPAPRRLAGHWPQPMPAGSKNAQAGSPTPAPLRYRRSPPRPIPDGTAAAAGIHQGRMTNQSWACGITLQAGGEHTWARRRPGYPSRRGTTPGLQPRAVARSG